MKTRIRRQRIRAVIVILLALIALLVAACKGTGSPAGKGAGKEVHADGRTEAGTGGELTRTAVIGDSSVEKYFQDACSGCHGAQRQGGVGPALIPARLDQSDAFYAETIKEGRPNTVMPPWKDQLKDDEVAALVAFLRTEPSQEAMNLRVEDIAASHQVLIPAEKLPASPTHDGNISDLVLVTEREARSIAVIDGSTRRLLGHVPASYRAHGYTFHPTNERWAYNVGRDGWVFKIDLYSLQPVAKIRVGVDSRGIAISDDGRYLIVGNFIPNSAVILDADTLEVAKVIETTGKDPDGKLVDSRVCITSDVSNDLVGPYFIIGLKEAGQVWRIDHSKPDFPIDKLENVGHILHDGFLSPDNRYFYVASQTDDWMAVIDVVEWKLAARIPTGKTPHPGSGATWEADGKTYGGTVHAGEGKITIWNLADNKIVAEIPTAGPGLFIRASENSPYVWTDALFGTPGNKIYVVDKQTFKLVKVIEEGTQTLHPEFNADGSQVYVSDWQENKVRVYDAVSLEKVDEIEGITTPTGIFSTSRRAEHLGH